MRAKEYIEQNQSSIQYLDDIKRVINELMPLRKNKEATDEYYNRYLLSDWRLDRYKIAMQDYQLNNGNVTTQPTLDKFEDEISAVEAPLFRSQLFETVKDDESFGYLFYQLGLEKNQKSAFYKSKPIQCIPDDEVIYKAVARYRDDYPKKQLDEYLDDTFNYEQYCSLTKNNLLPDEEKTILVYFNTSYEIYDRVRCLKNKLSQVNQYCNQYNFLNEKQKFCALSLVIKLIDEFEAQDTQLDRCKKELSKILFPLREKYEPKADTIPFSHISLNNKRGFKINYIRVINVLQEMGFFTDENDNNCTKKDVFAAFGETVGKDLSTFQNDLSTTNAASNSDMKRT